MTNEESLDSWKGIVSNYLKAENLPDKEGSFVAEDVRVVPRTQEDGSVRSQIEIDTTIGEVEYVFGLNYTNAKFVKTLCAAPKELLGKRIEYIKVKTRNPKTNQMVDSISITGIE